MKLHKREVCKDITIQDIIDGAGEGTVFPEHWKGLKQELGILVQDLNAAYNRCDKAGYSFLIEKFRQFIATDIGYELSR